MYFQIKKKLLLLQRWFEYQFCTTKRYESYFQMNVSPYCASNPGKIANHDTLFYGNHTGICKNGITSGDVILFISQGI